MIALYSWKKLLSFVVLSVAVFVVLLWIFNTLKQSFYKITRDNQRQLVTVLSEAAPREAELAESWIVAANREFTDADIIYVDGVPGWGELT
ncbi:MAG: iron ABC transporter permease, partial [Mesotoga sp.]|nr:iron ABC transporter permease [Mesotoga sp.]